MKCPMPQRNDLSRSLVAFQLIVALARKLLSASWTMLQEPA
jgi:hypothetical protein